MWGADGDDLSQLKQIGLWLWILTDLRNKVRQTEAVANGNIGVSDLKNLAHTD